MGPKTLRAWPPITVARAPARGESQRRPPPPHDHDETRYTPHHAPLQYLQFCPRVLPAACASVCCRAALLQPGRMEPSSLAGSALHIGALGNGLGEDGVGIARQPSSTGDCGLLLLCRAGSSARYLRNAVCEPLLSSCPCQSVSLSCLVARASALMPDSDRVAAMRLWDLPSGESAR